MVLCPKNVVAAECAASSDPSKFRNDLYNIARTTLSSKVLSQDKGYFADLAVDAVLRLKVGDIALSMLPRAAIFIGFNGSGTHSNHQESWWETDGFLPR